MLVKKIKYTDFNGNEREEEFYFNISKAELIEMELKTNGGFDTMLRKIISQQDSKKIVEIFKNLILKAYGVKSDDGRRFIKSKELSEEFSQTNAYNDLFLELTTNSDKAKEFVNGIIDPSLQGELKKANLEVISKA